MRMRRIASTGMVMKMIPLRGEASPAIKPKRAPVLATWVRWKKS
jgi:hypothetical protein